MRYIGIDPGLSGGIAALNSDGTVLDVGKMPSELDALYYCIERYRSDGDDCRAALEFVRSSPQMGVASSFKFGRGYGAIEMALVAARVPYYDVHPLRWQRALGCLSRGDKNITKSKAAALWPSHKITHAIADALLIAEWCRRSNLGLLTKTAGGAQQG